ncbi:MAG: ABC transporter permease [Allomuricauda sp.]
MYNLFLKIATRYLLKNKLYSFINIFGLAIGVASFILIMLYVDYEYDYDTFEGSEDVYRVYMDYTESGAFVPGDAQAYNLSGPTLKESFSEIEEYVRLVYRSDVIFKYNNTPIDGESGALADPSYFDVFHYPLLVGSTHTVLRDPFTVVLTESLAKKIFGNTDPIGKSLEIVLYGPHSYTVNGIMKDPPSSTHMKNDFLISYATALILTPEDAKPNWNSNNRFTYIKLAKGTDAGLLKKKVMDFKVESLPFERHNIEPLEAIHLHSDKPFEAETNGSASRVRFLLAIAFIIIILSWLNYVNLSTAKSFERAKETGIRKVAGAQKKQIILQSLLESLLLNAIAVGLALMIVLGVLPKFNNYIHKELSMDLSNLGQLLPIFGFILLGSVMAGMYPAYLLSRYTPVKALKGKIHASGGGLIIRKGLITGQFLATMVLLVGTIVVGKQIGYLQNQPIGAKLDQVMAINGTIMDNKPYSLILQDRRILKGELKDLPFVKNTALVQTYPGGGYDELSSSVGITFPDGTRDNSRVWYNYGVSPEYFEMMDLEFIAGKPFAETPQGNSNNIVMNEQFVRHMGIANMEEAIGKTVKFWDADWMITGVIKNYHHFGLKTGIEPMMLRYNDTGRNIVVKMDQSVLSTAGMNRAISQIESKWKALFPDSTFNYAFLDQKFEAQYNEDRAFGEAFRIFTVLAIIIASMGLFGLTSYTVVQRKKEIGIRKVNGATIAQILTMLNRDFVTWVGVAFIMAVPISWYVMDRWLEGFAYRTKVSWWVFALAGTIALLIALATVSWQSVRAAMSNPVDSLRDE